MAKLTELFKAIQSKKVLANESNDSHLAVLVRIDGEYDNVNCIYNNYKVQAVVCDEEGTVKVSSVVKADRQGDWPIEDSLEMNVKLTNDGIIVGISYYDAEEEEFLYHTETL